MKLLFCFPQILFFCLLSAFATAQNQHPVFGKYYTIPNSNVSAPFPAIPYKPTEKVNELFKLNSLAYAYPEPDDDSNLLYCVEVIDFLTEDFKSGKDKVDFYEKNQTLNMQFSFQGKLIETERFGEGSEYTVKTKIHVTQEFGSGILVSQFWFKDETVIHTYVITSAENENNSKIQSFFDAVN